MGIISYYKALDIASILHFETKTNQKGSVILHLYTITMTALPELRIPVALSRALRPEPESCVPRPKYWAPSAEPGSPKAARLIQKSDYQAKIEYLLDAGISECDLDTIVAIHIQPRESWGDYIYRASRHSAHARGALLHVLLGQLDLRPMVASGARFNTAQYSSTLNRVLDAITYIETGSISGYAHPVIGGRPS